MEEEINKSFQTLKSRYGNDSFLQKAALRRTHLNYDRCIALCGSMLEALLQMKIREELKKYGKKAISIILDKEEVRVLKDDGYQITSYYCLSRMRRIFKRILVLE